MGKLSPDAELVRCMLTGVPVVGREPDLNRLADDELGELAASAWGPQPGGVRTFEVRRILLERSPSFDADSAVAALEALAESARKEFEAAGRPVVGQWVWEPAAQVVAGCAGFDEPKVIRALQYLLSRGVDSQSGDIGIALLSCAGLEVPEHPDELIRAEHRFMCGLDLPRDRIRMAQMCKVWSTGADDQDLSPRGADPLALLPGYLEHAESLTATALERANAVQSGAVDYKADKAFTVGEAQAIRRCLRAGLDQGAEWALKRTIPLLTAVSQAPDQKAKSVPSQSASIAIAKAIAERPSAPLVTGMKTAIAGIRHAGVKKKLGRLVKTAERRMFEDDGFLFALDTDSMIPRSLSRAVVRALEALFLRSTPVALGLWLSRILGNHAVAREAAALVWRFGDGTSAIPETSGEGWSFVGADGQPCTPKSETVALWHPLQHDAGASAWRAHILQHRIQQPFSQVFRETYTENSLSQLMSPQLDLRTLLGLARSQGWVLREGFLLRKMGPFRVEMDVGQVYPGAVGRTRCHAIELFRGAAREPVCLADEDPQLVSECLRAVDLLVSVSAFAIDPDCAFESGSARERRAALMGMLGSSPTADRPFVEGRSVRFGDLKISIATARATLNGEEIELPSASPRIPVLPYPDEILQRIVAGLNEFDRGSP